VAVDRFEGDEGAPVLMLAHPLGTNLHIFDRLMPALRRHFRVVRYDARGHGESVVTPDPYTLDQLGQDALDILDALGIERADWLGLSKGAAVGLQLLTHAPKRIGRAVLANVAAQLGSANMWNERIKTVREQGIESVAPSLLENWFSRDFRDHHAQEIERVKRMLLTTPADGYAGACAALRDMDLRQAIGAITNPVLVIAGRHDPVATPDLGALVASAIPGAEFATLDTAHMSCIEDLEGFTGAAVEFLTAKSPVMAEETMHPIVEDATPEMAAEEGTPESAQTLMPPKKPRKPRAPRKPSEHKAEEPADMDTKEAPTAAPAQGHEPEMEPEPAPEPLGQAHPLAPPRRRKPRKPREAGVPAAPRSAPAEIAVKPSQPRKRPAKKAAAKKSAARAPAKTARAPAKKAAVKKTAAKKAPARKAVARKAVAKKAVARKAPAKKAAMRKVRAAAPARKAVVKKTAAKRSSPKKAVVRKAAAKRTVVKKAAARRIAVKKAPMRKAAAKKAVARKAVVKRMQAKKAGVKKTAAKKGASRKSTLRRTSGRPASRKR
jgi:3-oxoadipate enol-lactonase